MIGKPEQTKEVINWDKVIDGWELFMKFMNAIYKFGSCCLAKGGTISWMREHGLTHWPFQFRVPWPCSLSIYTLGLSVAALTLINPSDHFPYCSDHFLATSPYFASDGSAPAHLGPVLQLLPALPGLFFLLIGYRIFRGQ